MSELFEYLRSHPSLNADDKIGGTDLLHSQYSELCFSVHGSRTSHRMTRFGFPSIAVIDRQAEGQYETAFRKVVRGCNLVFLQLFQDRVRGPGNKHLKDHVALVLTIKQKAAIKTALKITVG